MTSQHKEDTEAALAALRTDLENQTKDKIEAMRIESMRFRIE
jgi:hypothetical protein